MNPREQELRNRLLELNQLKVRGDADRLLAWSREVGLALEFRATDAMIGLDEVDDVLISQANLAMDEALRAAAEIGHPEAKVLFSRNVWARRDSELAGTAAAMLRSVDETPEASYLLGLFAFNGFGVERDLEQSRSWHRNAAERGDASSMFELYAMLSQGLGGERNHDEAIAWCHRSAEAGNPRAMANLGGFYATGSGVEQNGELAVRWYAAAAEHGHGKAAATLGVMYALGDQVAESKDQAIHYFSLADECGYDWMELAEACGLDSEEYEVV